MDYGTSICSDWHRIAGSGLAMAARKVSLAIFRYGRQVMSETTRTTVKDPVCGMMIEKQGAPAQIQHQGQVYYFCSVQCRDEFVSSPEQYEEMDIEQREEEDY
jgi:YHS domain-containing protein